MKQVPEMSLKLTCNDRVKARFTANGRQVTLTERLAIGGVSGALAQVPVFCVVGAQLGLSRNRVSVGYTPCGLFSTVTSAQFLMHCSAF